MATMYLKPREANGQYYPSVIQSYTAKATLAGSDVISVSNKVKAVQLQIPTVASGTLTIQQKSPTAATWVNITRDIYGVSYPRANFTGSELVSFMPMAGADIRVHHSAAQPVIEVQGR